jgi:hypothetical protein
MYRAGRYSARERLVAWEVMKLERQQATRRSAHGRSRPEQRQSKLPAANPGRHLL